MNRRYSRQVPVSTSAAFSVVVAAALLVGSCGSAEADTQVRVSAASSLSDVFADLEVAFEKAHPGTDVLLNLGGSPILREQIIAGAPVDVFASASVEIMNQIEAAGLTENEISVFAKTEIEIAVPRGNPADIRGLEDFGRDDLFVGLCAESVPCGRLALDSLRAAGVEPLPVTYEPNVRSLLTKIEEGELDAGIVYTTDVIAGDVDGIAISKKFVSTATYPIALIGESPNPSGGADFIAFVFTAVGQEILLSHGFQTP